MKNMCVSAGILMPFNQIRYEHPHQKETNLFYSRFVSSLILKQVKNKTYSIDNGLILMKIRSFFILFVYIMNSKHTNLRVMAINEKPKEL